VTNVTSARSRARAIFPSNLSVQNFFAFWLTRSTAAIRVMLSIHSTGYNTEMIWGQIGALVAVACFAGVAFFMMR
jgi:hypothetical protein